MRITGIELRNFRAFYGDYHINLHKAGKNLLVYGENGSGKSSLYLALKLFLESSEEGHQFEAHRNIFHADDGYIKLHLRANARSKQHTYEWSRTVKETEDLLISDASKSKGFLDYKVLLETHYVHREEEDVNVFKLLVENLLANTVNPLTNRTLSEEWEALQQVPQMEAQTENFNGELASRLNELQTLASEILRKFGYDVTLTLKFPGIAYNSETKTITRRTPRRRVITGIAYNSETKTLDNQRILLTVEFLDKQIPAHHRFLNEAKLSAISLAIYFAALLLQPESDLKVLALDDVLIGLDMSNRLPVLDILKTNFPNHQIFLTTYDKVWYEVVKQRTSAKEWKYAEFYFSKSDEAEIPVYVEGKAYLDKAREFLTANDHKACAIYLRSAFEEVIKKCCDRKRLPVRYRSEPNQLTSQDFWDAIKIANQNSAFFTQSFMNEIELYRSRILNPLSHATIANIPRKEIEDAIEAVERLKIALLG